MSVLLVLRRSFLLSAVASALAMAAVVLAPRPAAGEVVFTASGTSSAGRPVTFQATLTITGSNLQVILENLSLVKTAEAADVLTSFYFDISNGTKPPTLNYIDASGFVYQVNKGLGNDVAVYYTPPMPPTPGTKASNLKAVNNGDASWQFLPMNPALSPNLGFGIGTVANNTLSPNDFTPAVVGPSGNDFINFGIYSGDDIDAKGVLDGKYLVKNKATFNFSGVGGYTENDIRRRAVFGLGTGPDSIVIVTEPSAIVISAGVLALAVCKATRVGDRLKPVLLRS